MTANGGPPVPPGPAYARPAYAGLATRTLAFAIDAAIINGVAWVTGALIALGLSLFHLPQAVKVALAAIGGVIALIWCVGYFAFFWSAEGQTPGDRLMGIRVVLARTGEPLHAVRALLRVFALVLSALPLCAGFLLILVDDRCRALHDRLIGTVVVFAPVSRPPRTRPVTLAAAPKQEVYR